MSKKVQTYEGKSITVHFNPARCIHSGNCVRGLPRVFRPNVKGPWINPDEAGADELAALIRTCPSGALTYTRSDGAAEQAPPINSITVEADGPLRVHADYAINGKKAEDFRATLCRCGATRNQPYCDGSHEEAGFRHDGSCPSVNLAGEIGKGPLNIKTLPNGPLLVTGPCEIRSADGNVVSRGKQAALCRCGASRNKPYCDGTHMAIGYKSKV